MVVVLSSSPGGNFFVGLTAKLGLAYYSVSVGLTAMLTWMICYRILKRAGEVRNDLGKDYASAYFALLSLMIESVLPYTLSGIAFLVSFGVGSPTSIAFACVYIMMMVSRSMWWSVMRANGFAVCITADADTADGIWRGMDRGDSQGTATDAQVQDAWGVALFRRQRYGAGR